MSFTPTPFIKNINSTSMVEVSKESDFGTEVGGVITLAGNTTYFIRGEVRCTNRLSIISAGTAIIGWNRDEDSLIFTGLPSVSDFITVTEKSFEIANIKLSSNNNTGGTVLLRAVNYNQPDYNAGRDKVLTIVNCQFRNCFDVWYIEGFDLIDIQNTIVWYIEATTIGCQFKNVSKLQLSSCEFVRWFDETLISNSLGAWDAVTSYSLGDIVTEGPTFYRALTNNTNRQPSTTLGVDWEVTGYATTPMIELLDNGGGSGFGAVNISGCVIHPQQTQNGIDISNSATIGFGTIASNTGIDIGLSTGVVANFDYDIQNTTIVQANQKIQNGNAKGTLSILGNTNALNTGTINPQVLAEANVATGAFTNTPTFPVANRVITNVANCSFTYNSKIQANFFVAVTATVEQSGSAFITCRLRGNGVAIPAPVGVVEIRSGVSQVLSFSVLGVASQGDVFDIEFESSNGSDITVLDIVLNGYQF
jgi:hypothetical protein